MIWLELGLVAFVIIGALFAATIRDLVGSVVTFAGLTLGVAIIWVLLAAPDVALIEAAVGAGVTSVLFMIALVKTSKSRSDSEDEDDTERIFRSGNLPALLLVGGLAIPLGYAFLSLDPVGAANAPAVSTTFADGAQTPYGYYIEETIPETGFSNSVVAVLVVYRGLDTLGELIVAFSAAVSILIVLERSDIL